MFLVMLGLMNQCLSDASDGGENLLVGSSFLRGLIVTITLTWFPFPIWYALSPEGFNVIKDEAGMKVAVAFLNVLSKGAFIMYLARIRTDYNTREKTMLSVGYIKDMKSDFDGLEAKKPADKDSLDKILSMLIHDVLESMGRAKDKDHLVEVLEAHLVTTNEDIISLTKEYCQEIGMPWGLILALKSKIRSYNVQTDDPWSMQAMNSVKEIEHSFSAPHIAKNQEKIKDVMKRKQSKVIGDDRSVMGDDKSEKGSLCGGYYPSSPRSTRPSTLAYSSSGAVPTMSAPLSHVGQDDGPQTDEINRLHMLIESQQKNVNGQVDECSQFVTQSMDRILDVLEQ